MPPDRIGKKLTKTQIDLLTLWIADGAEYQGHWAFLPVERPKPPTDGHAVDAFIRAGLAAEKLKPQPEADKRTLIRRQVPFVAHLRSRYETDVKGGESCGRSAHVPPFTLMDSMAFTISRTGASCAARDRY